MLVFVVVINKVHSKMDTFRSVRKHTHLQPHTHPEKNSLTHYCGRFVFSDCDRNLDVKAISRLTLSRLDKNKHVTG